MRCACCAAPASSQVRREPPQEQWSLLGSSFLFDDNDLHVHHVGVELIFPPVGPPFVQKNLDGAPQADPTRNLQPVAEQGAQKARHECGPTQECGQEETTRQKDESYL